MHFRSKTRFLKEPDSRSGYDKIRRIIDVPWIGTAEIAVRKNLQSTQTVYDVVPTDLQKMLVEEVPTVRFSDVQGIDGFRVVPDGAALLLTGLTPYMICNHRLNMEKTVVTIEVGNSSVTHVTFGQVNPARRDNKCGIIGIAFGEPVPMPPRQSLDVVFKMDTAGAKSILEAIMNFKAGDVLVVGIKLIGFYRYGVDMDF